jgi:hypothetical protein
MTRRRAASVVAAVAVAAVVGGCSGDAAGPSGAPASQSPTTALPSPGAADAPSLDPAAFVAGFSRLTVRGGSQTAVTQAVGEAEQLAGLQAPDRRVRADGDAFIVDYATALPPGVTAQLAGFVSHRFPATGAEVAGTGVALTVTPAPGSRLEAGEPVLGALDALGLHGLTEERNDRNGTWRYTYRGETLPPEVLNDLRGAIAEAAGVPEGEVTAAAA